MEIIQELANQLGVAVEYLLNAYAPYCLGAIIGVTTASFVVFVASLIVLILSLKAMLYNYNAFQNCDNPNVWVYGIIAFIVAFIVLIALCVFVASVPKLIGAIMSPQGVAIADIVAKITG